MIVNKEFITNLLEEDRRVDRRDKNKYRDIEIEKDVVSSAQGSARVKIGNTEVVAGVKIELGEPFPDSPDEGVLMVNSEFLPLAFEEFERGRPGKKSVELSRVVDRTIRESKAIDVKKLCIEEGEKIWMVFVDVDVMDQDGNLMDAACLAAVQALISARMPKLEKDGDKYTVDFSVATKEKLPMTKIPVMNTYTKIGEHIVVDATLREEEAMDARLSIGTFEENGETKYCAMQKGGVGGITEQEISKMLDMAEKHCKELREKLEN